MAKIAFIGAGRMASAIVGGILDKGLCAPSDVVCSSADDGTGEKLAERVGIGFEPDSVAMLKDADVVVLAFKPQQMRHMNAKHAAAAAGKLIVSILAGTTIERLEEAFPKARNIVRAMPNTPGQIGAGVTAFASKSPLSQEDRDTVEGILAALGKVFELEEEKLDAVTAVSGSGPAYIFEFVAALRDGGIDAGLPKEIAYQLALETTLGAAKLLAHTEERPETLRDRVTSPGGTTLAGLRVMSQANFRDIVNGTVQAAKKRSIELSKD